MFKRLDLVAIDVLAKKRAATRLIASEIPSNERDKGDDVHKRSSHDDQHKGGRLALYGIRLVRSRNHRRL